ncbi:hypothetical protein MHI32_22960 [Paenibacillus sp. FSL H7-0690]|uniref:hypothetical protein n=1 Tax=Paenibacillus sp. FSL H7-0690 TaxID=2921437 RepID=UPI0030ECEA6C
MVNDVGIHCSEKYVHYINRKKNPRGFERIEETIAEMNAVFSEMSEDFLIEDHKMMKVARKRINQAKGEIESEETKWAEKREGKETARGAFICNFFVVPINRLRVYDLQKQKTTEVGLNVKVYTRINKKEYKCIELDLLNETLANSKWIDPNFLDYDLYLYRENLYAYLLRAIRLATRLLEDDDEKVIFNDEIGWVNYFWGVDEDGYVCYMKEKQPLKWKESEIKEIEIDPMKVNAITFLKVVQKLIDDSKFQPMNDSSKLKDGIIGWESTVSWAIKFDELKSYVKEAVKRSSRNFKIDKKLYAFLNNQGILTIEGHVEERFRPDTKFGKGNERAFVLDKKRFKEYLDENKDTTEYQLST